MKKLPHISKRFVYDIKYNRSYYIAQKKAMKYVEELVEQGYKYVRVVASRPVETFGFWVETKNTSMSKRYFDTVIYEYIETEKEITIKWFDNATYQQKVTANTRNSTTAIQNNGVGSGGRKGKIVHKK